MKKRLKRIVASAVIMCVISSNSLVNNVITAYAETDDKESVKGTQVYEVNKNTSESISSIAESLKGQGVNMAHKAEDEVDIIIELEGKSILQHYIDDNGSTTISSFTISAPGRKISKNILKEHKSMINKIKSEVSSDIEIEAEYSVVINGFSVKAKYSDLESIKQVKGVKTAFVATTYDIPTNPEVDIEPLMVNSNGYIGVTEANKAGYTGKKTAVAILDTGLDINHEAFQQSPSEVKYSQEEINNMVANSLLNANGNVYKSEKIPFAYDYADSDDNPADAAEHGTHVAGTVGANGERVKGVAPDAQLMIMKVFSSNGGGASDKTILAALDDAVKLGVDSINMSLGSAAGFTSEGQDVLDNTYNRIAEAGISLMCAAGNDESSTVNSNKGNFPLVSNPDNSIVGSPSTYSAATSIASVNNVKSFSPYFTLGKFKIKYSDTNKGKAKDFTTLQGEKLEYVVVPGIGSVSDFEQVNVAGKIALVQRGIIPFTEKETNAHAYDAKGVIIYDNEDGALMNMQTEGKLPMIAISKSDGEVMLAAEEKKINVNESFIDSFEDVTSGKMSDFSSWGVSPDLKLKPEITAPGGGIFSTLPGNSYGSMSGTSMACPHAAGAAALVRQYVNEKFTGLTTVEKDEILTNLLMSTASPVIDENGVFYSPRKQGAGLINVNSAIKSGAYITAPAGKPKAELGDSTIGEYTFTFDVNNVSENTLSYNLNTTVLTEKLFSQNGENYFSQASRVLDSSEVVVTASESNISIKPGEKKTITVSLKLTDKAKTNLSLCENGTFIDGFVTLESLNDDKINVGLPFVGFYGDWGKAPTLDSTLYDNEEAVMWDTTLALLDIYTGNGYFLGVNNFLKELVADKNKIAIGEGLTGANVLTSLVGLLRNVEDLDIKITNDKGEQVYARNLGKNAKSYYYNNGGFITYAMDGYGWDAVDWDNRKVYPDGKYTYTIEAKGFGDDDKTKEVLSFPVTIDTEKAKMTGKENITIDGVEYLEIKVKDNHYLQGVQLYDYKNNPLSDIIPLNEDTEGFEHTLLFPLEDLKGVTALKIAGMDYANNFFESPVFGATDEGILPESIIINSRELTIAEGGTFDFSAIVYPEIAENKTVTWQSSDPEVATIDNNGHLVAVKAGKTTITASTFNGKTDSTWVSVYEAPAEELVEPFVITTDGKYSIPANLSNKTITIKDTAKNVTINGNEVNGVNNPYNGLAIVAEGDVNLVMKNVNINRTKDTLLVDLKGTSNTLTLVGENNLTSSQSYSSRAMVNVPEGRTLEIKGDGKLNINPGKSNFGTCIGGSANDLAQNNSGKIIISSGEVNTVTHGGAAAIGGAGDGIATDIRITGGKVTAIVDADNSSHGAGIGSSGSGYNYEGKNGSIRISGGEVYASTNGGGAAIGDCKGGNTPYNIIISGGIVNAETISNDEFAAGAAIGGGTSSRGNIRITVLGGQVNAKSSSSAAAIGGGADNRAGSVSIEGGTVTAEATGKGAAIGNASFGESQTVRLLKGTVKATSIQSGVDPIGNGEKGKNCTIVGADGTTPYKAVIYAPQVTSVKVNGEDWKISKSHPEDENIYLYFVNSTSPYEVEVTAGETVTQYSVTVKDGNVTVGLLDIVPPAAPSISEVNGIVTVTAADEDTEVIEYSLDGENWIVYTEPVEVPEKGTIHVRAKDVAGNVSEVVTYIVPDRTAPAAPSISEEAGVVTLTATDEDTVVMEYSLDGESWTVYTVPVEVPEKSTIYVRAKDAVGNISGVVTYTVPDRTAPAAPKVSEDNGVVTVTAADEDTEVIEYSLDGENWIVYTVPVEVPEKSKIYVRAKDAAGNISGVVTYTVPDRTAPVTPVVSEAGGVVTITAADEDTEVIEYSLDGENWIVYTEPVEVPEKVTIHVRAKDAAGNVSEVTTYTVPDRTAPIAPLVIEADGVVTLTAADEDTEVIEYSLDGEDWIAYTEPVEVPEKVTIHVRAKDAAGNISEVTTYTVPDRTAPSKPVVEFKDGLVTIIALDEDTAKVEYSFDGLTWIGYKMPFEVTENCTIFVRAIDEAGNVSEIAQLKVTIDNSALENLEKLVGEAEKLDKKLYTSATWKKLDIALLNAKKVLASENPSEEEILKATESLEKAIKNLEEKKDDDGNGNNSGNNNNGGGNNSNGSGNGNKPGTGLPQTGGFVGGGILSMAGILASAAGVVIFKKKRVNKIT